MTKPSKVIDFQNTRIAFEAKSDEELKQTIRLFKLMSNPLLVKIGSGLTLKAIQWQLPFIQKYVKKTFFKQFCGGVNLLDSQKTVDKLFKHEVQTILDYGAEGKNEESEFDLVMDENINAIDFAASNLSVPIISVKVSGLVKNKILFRRQEESSWSNEDQNKWEALKRRIHKICKHAEERKVGIFIDAEESWYQDAIDEIVLEAMETYNSERCIVYNTYQLYRKDKLAHLKRDFEIAQQKGFILGAKLVRGAYMEKERKRAEEKGYESPIHKTKEATDNMYDEGLRFCIKHYKQIGSANASHNLKSVKLQAELIDKMNIPKDHPHLNFCQLYGMSDNLTFNLANEGYNVAKYVPYGPIKEVMPYLIRRAQENTSVTGEVGRELTMLLAEAKRRNVKAPMV